MPTPELAKIADLLRKRGLALPAGSESDAMTLAAAIRTSPRRPTRPPVAEPEETHDADQYEDDEDNEDNQDDEPEDVSGLSHGAVHEAGHVLVYLATDVPGKLEAVSLGARDKPGQPGQPGSLARTYFKRDPNHPEHDRSDRLATAAGCIAEMQILGCKLPGGNIGDMAALMESGGPLDSDEEEQAQLIVAELRREIILLARELDKRGTMTGRQIIEYLRKHNRDTRPDDDDEFHEDIGEMLSFTAGHGGRDSELPFVSGGD